MKKLLLASLLFVGTAMFSQTKPISGAEKNLPAGLFLNDIFDSNGNKYSLGDLQVGAVKYSKNDNSELSSALLCSPGMFDLYFETGSGMTGNTAVEVSRRAVICQVFQDISAFINSPLKNAGNQTRVRIWVRDINQVLTSSQLPASTSNVSGIASAFYNFPNNATPGFGGIADNEIWKTIHLGKDSFTNVIAPLISTSPNPGASGLFYHGIVAVNFSNSSIAWNTNYSIATPAGTIDLYSVMLHEITHALGFNSLISATGNSRYGNGYNYYSRYDRYLKNNPASAFLISNGSSCSMYNYTFNTALSTGILQPNTSSCISGQTNCASAIKFVGSSTVPVYTPNCFEPSSSLSHFEDQCIAAPNANNTNAYFLMSDAISAGMTKRFLRNEERNALNDIGYKLTPTFGNNSVVFGSYFNYGYATSGIAVAGLNDGLAENSFTYIGTSGTNILINSSSNGLLSNDYTTVMSNLRFECLQDIYDSSSTLSATSGDINTTVNFSSTHTGLHLLRYVPYDNSNGQRGNITYIYVYVNPVPVAANCTPTPNTCNLVNNGNFEEKSAAPTQVDQMNLACGWLQTGYSTMPSYVSSDSPTASLHVPCLGGGYETDKLGLKSYIWLNFFSNEGGNSGPHYESAKTQLSTPLTPNTEYQLSFDVSLLEGSSANAVKLQACLSGTNYPQFAGGTLPINVTPNIFLENPTFSRVTSGWDRISFTFKTGSTSAEKYLYIGGLTNVQFSTNTVSAPVIPGCSYNTLGNSPPYSTWGLAVYALDNVALIPTNGVKITTPASVCVSQSIPNLANYVSGAVATGTFDLGDGVSVSGGVYTFNATTAGVGLHQITYNYYNNIGCLVSITTKITVSACSSSSCPGILIFNSPEPATTATYQAASNITANESYLVNSGATITFKAGDSITFSPNSEIRSGSNFTAQITQCTQTSSKSIFDADTDENIKTVGMTVYPNPTNGLLNMEMGDLKLVEISIYALDGKLVYVKNTEPVNSYQIDLSNFQKGFYILSVKTSDEQIITKKIARN